MNTIAKVIITQYSRASRLVDIILRKTMPKKQRIAASKDLHGTVFIAIRHMFLAQGFLEARGLTKEFETWAKEPMDELTKELAKCTPQKK